MIFFMITQKVIYLYRKDSDAMGREIAGNDYPKKNKGTFIVKIDHSQNGTWQGKVTWAEEDKSVHFRSMLELVKIIDESIARQTLFKEETEQEKSS